MKILVLGGAGYLGWPTAMYLSARGHEVEIIDNFIKLEWERKTKVKPLESNIFMSNRLRAWNDLGKGTISYTGLDLSSDLSLLNKYFRGYSPDAIIHYAEQPSAPYSMIHPFETQKNNVLGTLNLILSVKEHCPSAHIIKLGTMGEYGTPNIDIEEGWLDVVHKKRSDCVLYPKRPGSFYHLSKVHDSYNLEFACRTWGLRVTDLNQGIVYGTGTVETDLHPDLRTSFHYDHIFGTVLNRFITEAVVHRPLTVYGSGKQKRCFISILDTMRCVELACLNPPGPGEFRVFNQFTEVFSLLDLAERVARVARDAGFKVTVANIDNPRVESEGHYYKPSNRSLLKIGLRPHRLSDGVIEQMIHFVRNRDYLVDTSILRPKVTWR